MITPSFGLTATERVLPKLALDFTTALLDNRITFTRTTGASNPATYVNSSGYITAATNNQPRFDYDPVALVCKGLLIEESRTNLCLNSADFNTGWSKGSATVNTDQATAPDNTNTADLITVSADNGGVYQGFACTSGTIYTWSVYAKANTGDSIRIKAQATGTVAAFIFNLTNVTATLSAGSGTASIVSVGNGWYRCTVTATASGTGTGYHEIDVSTNTKSVYLWGAQIEAGAFATSYIPTTTTALTRNADVATMTGTNFSDWYNASEGTILAQGFPANAPVPVLVSIDDGVGTNRVVLRRNTSNTASNIRATGNGYSTDATFIDPLQNGKVRIAYGYKNASQYAASNGSNFSPAVSSVALIPTAVTQVTLGNSPGSSYLSGCLQQVLYWPFKLTQAEVQAFSKQG